MMWHHRHTGHISTHLHEPDVGLLDGGERGDGGVERGHGLGQDGLTLLLDGARRLKNKGGAGRGRGAWVRQGAWAWA